jgi:hypothetical protein
VSISVFLELIKCPLVPSSPVVPAPAHAVLSASWRFSMPAPSSPSAVTVTGSGPTGNTSNAPVYAHRHPPPRHRTGNAEAPPLGHQHPLDPAAPALNTIKSKTPVVEPQMVHGLPASPPSSFISEAVALPLSTWVLPLLEYCGSARLPAT